ncbi:MAG: hypothetical protein GYA17_17040, partial [Chloroflexi bacterium]|nr:hypothetical protein [Chloroflexota bacterium]
MVRHPYRFLWFIPAVLLLTAGVWFALGSGQALAGHASPAGTSMASRVAAEPTRRSTVTATVKRPSGTVTATPAAPSGTLAPAANQAAALPAERWKEWPELPAVSARAAQIYRQGLEKGTDPHAFSIVGDCQTQPEVFLGRYVEHPATAATLPLELRQTMNWFSASMDRYSPTVKDGTTAGAVLWGEWNDNPEKLCQVGETPLDCELRVHNPSIVLIHIGSHWEARNQHYLDLIIEKILAQGALPVLATKADNREQDERINYDMASIAQKYDLPLWNFWAAVQ